MLPKNMQVAAIYRKKRGEMLMLPDMQERSTARSKIQKCRFWY